MRKACQAWKVSTWIPEVQLCSNIEHKLFFYPFFNTVFKLRHYTGLQPVCRRKKCCVNIPGLFALKIGILDPGVYLATKHQGIQIDRCGSNTSHKSTCHINDNTVSGSGVFIQLMTYHVCMRYMWDEFLPYPV